MGRRRPYVSTEFGDLARLVMRQWPGVFRAEGDGFRLDRMVCHDLKVLVWMDGHPTTLPGESGWRMYKAPRRFDQMITLRCVAKDLRVAARKKFEVCDLRGRPGVDERRWTEKKRERPSSGPVKAPTPGGFLESKMREMGVQR